MSKNCANPANSEICYTLHRFCQLLRVLCTMPKDLGYIPYQHPTPLVDSDGRIVEFGIVLMRNARLTSVWEGLYDNQHKVAIKESSSAAKEAHILQALKECPNIPTVKSVIAIDHSKQYVIFDLTVSQLFFYYSVCDTVQL